MLKIDKYIARAVIRYLNGDMKLFERYRNIALKLLEKEKEFIAVEELIDKDTKAKLYNMVSWNGKEKGGYVNRKFRNR